MRRKDSVRSGMGGESWVGEARNQRDEQRRIIFYNWEPVKYCNDILASPDQKSPLPRPLAKVDGNPSIM